MPDPNAIKPLPSLAYLNECFHCDFVEGTLVWKKRPRDHFVADSAWLIFNGYWAGKTAGFNNDRCRAVSISMTTYSVHRVMWKMKKGYDPGDTVDHIDRNPFNNAFSNLRLATNNQQQYNKGLAKNNTSGHRGVYFDSQRKRWRVRIYFQDKQLYFGSYLTYEDAVVVHEREARRLFEDFYCET